jgi:hypothetical protein
VDRNPPASLSEAQGDGAADALRASRYQNGAYLIFHVIAHGVHR